MNLSDELTKRVITGVLGAAALIALFLYGGWIGITVFTGLLSVALAWEYSEMVFALEDRLEKKYLMLLLAWGVSVLNAILPNTEYGLLVLSFLVLFIYFLFTARTKLEDAYVTHFRELVLALFGTVYLVFLPLYLPRVHEGAGGAQWTLLFFLINWVDDSAAYFVGKKYGTKKLYPEISPKKTYEGAYGGLAGGVVVALLYKLLFFRGMPWLAVLVVPLFVGVFAQVGDLCESYLKRAYGKKDSGSILPGHGGFLDRFDGVVFSVPVMYACTRLFS